ncbi:hypothetical protein CDD83_836 [Cordyceps sp. RAO-2017]|nr:hypothetical protein CDD83_836 [Cordyceps sp. RAO-2017]
MRPRGRTGCTASLQAYRKRHVRAEAGHWRARPPVVCCSGLLWLPRQLPISGGGAELCCPERAFRLEELFGGTCTRGIRPGTARAFSVRFGGRLHACSWPTRGSGTCASGPPSSLRHQARHASLEPFFNPCLSLSRSPSSLEAPTIRSDPETLPHLDPAASPDNRFFQRSPLEHPELDVWAASVLPHPPPLLLARQSRAAATM